MANGNPVMVLKRGLLLFWALWLSIVWLGNLADAGKQLGLFDPSWRFASGNFDFVAATTSRYGVSDSINRVLFGGVLVWETIAVVLFWRAVGAYRNQARGRPAIYRAFASTLFLWGAFLLADEICIAYPLEATHLRLMIAQLLTLLLLEIVPDQKCFAPSRGKNFTRTAEATGSRPVADRSGFGN